jgi:hypothetical protein
MIPAHVGGVPVEESALALAPVGVAIVSGAAVIARSKLTKIIDRLPGKRETRHAHGHPARNGRDRRP